MTTLFLKTFIIFGWNFPTVEFVKFLIIKLFKAIGIALALEKCLNRHHEQAKVFKGAAIFIVVYLQDTSTILWVPVDASEGWNTI